VKWLIVRLYVGCSERLVNKDRVVTLDSDGQSLEPGTSRPSLGCYVIIIIIIISSSSSSRPHRMRTIAIDDPIAWASASQSVRPSAVCLSHKRVDDCSYLFAGWRHFDEAITTLL